MSDPDSQFKYSAFISYSRRDFVLATRLQRMLESYRIPKKVDCRWLPRGRRLYPVFRDSNELPASSDLGAILKAELSRSAALIVICSPDSAESRWVEQEVREFHSLGRGDRIYAVLAKGEPPACFPPVLLQLREQEAEGGNSHSHRQPLAADMRPHTLQGRGLRARLREEKLRLIAGLVGTGYENLAQRDRKRVRLRRTVVSLVAVTVLTLSTLGFLWQRKQYEERIQKNNIQDLIEKGQRQLLAGDPLRALPYLSAAYSKGESSRDLAFSLARAMAPLDARQVAIPGVLGGGFTPSGKSLLTINQNGKVFLHDAKTGKVIRSLDLSPDPMSGFAFNGNGLSLATISGKRVQLWDMESGRLRATLDGHKYDIKSIRFSPDHQFLVTASVDNTARTWDSDSGRLLHILHGHSASVLYADISPDGSEILTVSNDRTVRLWDSRTGRPLRQFHTKGTFQSGRYSPDGKRILLMGAPFRNTLVCLYQRAGGLLGCFNRPEQVVTADFSPDNSYILIVTAESGGKSFRVWKLPGEELAFTLTGHTELAGLAWFSPDRKKMITAGFDGVPRIWDTSTGSLRDVLNIPPSGEPISRAVLFAEFSPEGGQLLILTGDNEMSLWNLDVSHRPLAGHEPGLFTVSYDKGGSHILSSDRKASFLWTPTGKLLAKIEPAGGILKSFFDPVGKRVLTASHTRVQLWSVPEGQLISTFEGHTETIASAGFSPDGKNMVTVGDDGLTSLWDVDHGLRLAVLPRYPVRMNSVEFSPDGRRILLTAWDQSVVVWDAMLKQRLCVLVKPSGIGLSSARFSPDGRFILTGGQSPTVWSSECQLVARFPSRGDTIIADISPDGKRFITTEMGGATVIRRTEDAALQVTLQNYPILPSSARFSPDGNWVLLSGVAKADLWNAITGRLLFSFGGWAQVGAAAFSPRGDTIATAAADGSLELWRIGVESRSPEQVGQLVTSMAPWQLRNGVVFKRPVSLKNQRDTLR